MPPEPVEGLVEGGVAVITGYKFSQGEKVMTSQQNKSITRRYYEDHADLEAAFNNVSPQAIPHVSGASTYEVWKGMHQMFIGAFPDMHLRRPATSRARVCTARTLSARARALYPGRQ